MQPDEFSRALTPTPPVTQDEADDAAAALAAWWPEIGLRWPWTRQRDLIPVYKRIGETLVALLRAVPQIQWSDQRGWYRRVVRDTPAIYALFPDAFAEQARALDPQGDPRDVEGKRAASFIYLAEGAGAEDGETIVAKSLLVASGPDDAAFRAQVAHEALNGFCATEWDGETLRSGIRRARWGAGARLQAGGALNDLLLDVVLWPLFPLWFDVPHATLLGGMQGPYWRLVERATVPFASAPVRPALFARDAGALPALERALADALAFPNAAAELDRALARHAWDDAATLLGEE